MPAKPKAPARNRRQFLVGVDVPAGVTPEGVAEAIRLCVFVNLHHVLALPADRVDRDYLRVKLIPLERK